MILLDTHSLIWWFDNDPRLSTSAKQTTGKLNKDPADRIIVATAMQLNIPIVTTDARIRAYPHVQTIW
jgi:PIN domain nuclease of toxin-antitoxin system